MKLLIYILFLVNLINGQDVTLNIDKYLNNKFSAYKKYEYKLVTNLSKLGVKSIEVNSNGELTIRNGFAYLPVIMTNNNGVKKSSVLTYKIKLIDNALFTLKDIKRGEVLNHTFFEYKEVDLAKYGDKIIRTLKEIEGKRALFNIAKGKLISKHQIENIPVINSGDVVNAFLIKGSVEISFTAKSRDDGGIGDKIRIRSGMGKQYHAKVIDNKRVIILE